MIRAHSLRSDNYIIGFFIGIQRRGSGFDIKEFAGAHKGVSEGDVAPPWKLDFFFLSFLTGIVQFGEYFWVQIGLHV